MFLDGKSGSVNSAAHFIVSVCIMLLWQHSTCKQCLVSYRKWETNNQNSILEQYEFICLANKRFEIQFFFRAELVV